jgi:acetyl esterase/lipase
MGPTVNAPLQRALELWPQVWPSMANPTIDDFREHFEAWSADNFPVADDVRSEHVQAGGVPSRWITVDGQRPSATETTILYLHGGSFALGSARCYTDLVSRLARACQARALVPDYRRAPEDPFPAGLDDIRSAYRWLVDSGTDPQRLVVIGDSAGGNLALALALTLREDEDADPPAAIVCLSPLTDMEATGATMESNAHLDPVISRATLQQVIPMYLGEADARDPLVSPLYGEYEGFPPLLIQVGTREVLLDDAVRVADRARQAGVDVVLDVADEMPHVWQMFAGFLPEAEDAIARVARFVGRHTTAAG